MNLEKLKENKELVSSVLLVVSLLAAVLMLVKVTGFFVTSARAGSAVAGAIQQGKPDAKHLSAQLDKSKKVAEALKKNNLFAPPPPRENPITAVMGIMGDEALINGEWRKVGQDVGDAKILAVNPSSVEVEWDGTKKTFSPIDGGESSGGDGPGRAGRSRSRGTSGSARNGRPDMVVTEGAKPASTGAASGPSDWQEVTREKLMSMSEPERNRYRALMREKYQSLPESEREAFRIKMREQFGGRPGGGEGRGRGRPGGRQPMRTNAR